MGSEDSRRKLLKALGLVGAGAAIQSALLPAAWVKPVIDSVIPSASAQSRRLNGASPTPSTSAIPASVTPTPTPTASPRPIIFKDRFQPGA